MIFCKLKQKYDYIQNFILQSQKKLPLQEKYNKTSYYSLSINFNKDTYNLWTILSYAFIINSDLFNKKNYYMEYLIHVKNNIIIKLLYKTSEELSNIFNINSNDYKKYLQQSNYNLKYRFVK